MNEARFLRIWDIIGCRRRGIAPVLPVSRTTWLDGVRTGRYPKPIKLSERVTAWRAQDVFGLLNQPIK